MCEVNCDIGTLLSLARVTYTCHLDDYNKTSQHDCQSRPLYWSFPPSPRLLDRLLAPGHLLGPAWKMSVGCLNLCALLAQMSVTITPGALLSLAWMSGLAPSCTWPPPPLLRIGQCRLLACCWRQHHCQHHHQRPRHRHAPCRRPTPASGSRRTSALPPWHPPSAAVPATPKTHQWDASPERSSSSP